MIRLLTLMKRRIPMRRVWIPLLAAVFCIPPTLAAGMEPGLWQMTVAGHLRVPGAALNAPVRRRSTLCMAPREPAENVFLPQHHQLCLTDHHALGASREAWSIRCAVPHGQVAQKGWTQSTARTFLAHWRMVETPDQGPASTTTMVMKGRWVAPDCGKK